ncbi:MAG: class II aldolase/adducin family protein [Candidatus Gastranaerophilales bacterium]|nr:class II aldolase/adducin family protein [Candidatus Gastranaerophilales bacterium]
MKDKLICYGKKIYDKGLSPATSGNISLIDNDNNILITSSGSCLGELDNDDIIKINFNGNILDGSKKPSSELFMHILIYKKNPVIKAIIHSHSPAVTAFSVAEEKMDKPILPEFPLYFGEIPTVKYFTPSSSELANAVSEKFSEYNAVLMQNHGITVGGKDIKEAFYLLEFVQAYSLTYIYSKILGRQKTLNKFQVEEIRKLKN